MTIKVGIVGVGNCCSSLVQGIRSYRPNEGFMGVMFNDIGGYRVSDIDIVAAFDVDDGKVGKDLDEAIFAPPNNTIKICDLKRSGVVVSRGFSGDGIGKYSLIQKKSAVSYVNVAKVLKESGAEIVVNYLPVGSELATKWYVEQALDAGCAFINAIPVAIASDSTGGWPNRFKEAGLPVFGDDIKSQLGATIVHRVLARLFEERAVVLDRTFQLNYGGNADFSNMREMERLKTKKISKTGSVQSQLERRLGSKNIHIGPSDYIEWLDDRKWCDIHMEGRGFAGVPIELDLRLKVWDSPNSAGCVVDVIRLAKVALDRKVSGSIEVPSAFYFKMPPAYSEQDDFRLKEMLGAWIADGRNESA